MNERTEIAAMCLRELLKDTTEVDISHIKETLGLSKETEYKFNVHWPQYIAKLSVAHTDTLLAELAKTEPKKRPWKVMDKVMITKCLNAHEFEIGEIVSLSVESSGGYNTPKWLATDGKMSWWISEEEAELVTY